MPWSEKYQRGNTKATMAQHFDALERIKELCKERGYSYYELAKRSQIPYSTLNTMILKNNSPTLPTLCKLCEGFGISMIQFFDGTESLQALTPAQQECMQLFSALPPQDQQLALAYMKGLAHRL